MVPLPPPLHHHLGHLWITRQHGAALGSGGGPQHLHADQPQEEHPGAVCAPEREHVCFCVTRQHQAVVPSRGQVHPGEGMRERERKKKRKKKKRRGKRVCGEREGGEEEREPRAWHWWESRADPQAWTLVAWTALPASLALQNLLSLPCLPAPAARRRVTLRRGGKDTDAGA